MLYTWYTHTHIYIYKYTYIYTYIYIYIYIYIYASFVYIGTDIYTHTHIYIYIYLCTYAHTHTQSHTQDTSISRTKCPLICSNNSSICTVCVLKVPLDGVVCATSQTWFGRRWCQIIRSGCPSYSCFGIGIGGYWWKILVNMITICHYITYTTIYI